MPADGASWDEAVSRLEEVLARHPFDRALPPIEQLLDEARIDRDVLAGDERAQKILDEAVRARPLSTLEAIAEVRTQVEVLSVEVGMLHRQLAGEALTDEELEDAGRRLAAIRALLDETSDQL